MELVGDRKWRWMGEADISEWDGSVVRVGWMTDGDLVRICYSDPEEVHTVTRSYWESLAPRSVGLGAAS